MRQLYLSKAEGREKNLMAKKKIEESVLTYKPR